MDTLVNTPAVAAETAQSPTMTKKNQSYFCVPSTPEGRAFETPLRGSDATYLPIMDVPICYVWPEHQIQPEALRISLEKTLDIFPVAAARLVTRYGRYHFTCKGSQGAVLQVVYHKGGMPTAETPSVAWSKYFSNNIYRQTKPPPAQVPLLSAHLNIFEQGGCALCISFAHILTDGAALVAFTQTWSQLCGKVTESSIFLPAEPLPKPVLQRSIPKEKLPTEKTVIQTFHRARVSYPTVILNGAQILVRNKMIDDVVDFNVSSADMSTFKSKLSEKLEKPKWISSYEAVMSMLVRALAAADHKKEIRCNVLVNIRGRSDLADPTYFGNALSYVPVIVEDKGDPSETAFAFHETLRAGLEDKELLNHAHYAAEHYYLRRFRLPLPHDASRWAQPFLHSLDGIPLVNSWVGFDMFNLDFGLNGQRPSFMRVAPTFRNHRHIHMFPSSPNGDLTLRMQLSRAKMSQFRNALKQFKLDDIIKEIKPV